MSKEIKRYLVCTFIFAWVLWGVIVMGGKLDIEILKYGAPLAMIFFVLGGLAPTICEIGIKKKFSTKKEFNSFLKNIINPKHNMVWYILIVGLSFMHSIIPVFFGQATASKPVYLAFVLLPIMIIGGGLEEVGWRGFLQPALQKKMSVMLSTVIVGAIWAIWHLPLWFIQGNIQSNMSFLNFCITGISLSFLLAGIYNATKSIFLCIIFHAFINSFSFVFVANDNLFTVCIAFIFDILVFLALTYFVKRKDSANKVVYIATN